MAPWPAHRDIRGWWPVTRSRRRRRQPSRRGGGVGARADESEHRGFQPRRDAPLRSEPPLAVGETTAGVVVGYLPSNPGLAGGTGKVEQAFKLYGDRDPREVPAYGISEAARYLDMPASTLRSWTMGQPYRVGTQQKFFEPIIDIADSERRYLSFFNLFEAYICDALRREHRVSLQQIRTARQLIETRIDPGSRHPLVEYRFATVGLDLFIDAYGELIGVKSAQADHHACSVGALSQASRS